MFNWIMLNSRYFEEKVAVRKERNAEVERRREALVETLREQSDKWITAQNYEDKIKEELFLFSTDQVAARARFDPSAASEGALTWLEKLQRMKPAGTVDESDDEEIDFEEDQEESNTVMSRDDEDKKE